MYTKSEEADFIVERRVEDDISHCYKREAERLPRLPEETMNEVITNFIQDAHLSSLSEKSRAMVR